MAQHELAQTKMAKHQFTKRHVEVGNFWNLETLMWKHWIIFNQFCFLTSSSFIISIASRSENATTLNSALMGGGWWSGWGWAWVIVSVSAVGNAHDPDVKKWTFWNTWIMRWCILHHVSTHFSVNFGFWVLWIYNLRFEILATTHLSSEMRAAICNGVFEKKTENFWKISGKCSESFRKKIRKISE